jgi:hypothetical protein
MQRNFQRERERERERERVLWRLSNVDCGGEEVDGLINAELTAREVTRLPVKLHRLCCISSDLQHNGLQYESMG